MKPIEKFAEKFDLTFPLASDEDHAVAGDLWHLGGEIHVWHASTWAWSAAASWSMPTGRLVKVWRKVKPEAHAAEVLQAAQGLK